MNNTCSILGEVINSASVLDYSLGCASNSTPILLSHYLDSINCCPCNSKQPKKCFSNLLSTCDSEGGGNVIIGVNCCDLCIYPNDAYPGVDACPVSIFPDGSIINVKMISPNNVNQCQG